MAEPSARSAKVMWSYFSIPAFAEPDARGRTALHLAVRACIDSYWKYRRQPDSVAALVAAGARVDGIDLPTGYSAIDDLLVAQLGDSASPNLES